MIGNALRVSTAVSSRIGGAVTSRAGAEFKGPTVDCDAGWNNDECNTGIQATPPPPRYFSAVKSVKAGQKEHGRVLAWVASMVPFALARSVVGASEGTMVVVTSTAHTMDKGGLCSVDQMTVSAAISTSGYPTSLTQAPNTAKPNVGAPISCGGDHTSITQPRNTGQPNVGAPISREGDQSMCTVPTTSLAVHKVPMTDSLATGTGRCTCQPSAPPTVNEETDCCPLNGML
eukprot:gene7704-871_t